MEYRHITKYHKFTLSANEQRCPAMMSPGDHKVLKYWAANNNQTMVEALHEVFTQGIKCYAENHVGQLERLAKRFGLNLELYT